MPAGSSPVLPAAGEAYRLIFAAGFDAAVISEAGRLLDVNAALERLTGYAREELIGRDLLQFVAPRSQAVVAAAVRENRPVRHEVHLLRKDGSVFEAEAQATMLPVEGRQLRLTVVRDITERRQSAETLHDSQVKLGLALGLARLGQWELDLATGQFTLDDDFLRLLGTSAPREGGHRMAAAEYARRFIPPDEAAIVAEETAKAVATTDPNFTRQLEHQFIRADGSLGVMLVRFAIVKDAAGRTVRTYGVNQDITEQKIAEQQRIRLGEQLEQAQKMEALGTLAGGIAHDFNNILTGILGHLQLAAADLPPGHPAGAGVSEAVRAGRRARDLVARILAFSRRAQHDRRAVSLAPVVEEAMHLLRASLPATIEIRLAVAPDCPPVHCDAAQIHQVLMNLGTNAAHAMRSRGGVLTIELGRAAPGNALRRRFPQVGPQHTVRLTVRDNGAGMSEAVLKRIFEPFYTTKETGEGSGLGLTVVYGIVQDHQGAIVVQSTPGQGTTFDLYFPSAEHANVPHASPVPAPPPAFVAFGGQRRIMLVDDDEHVRDVGRRFLARLGFDPVVYADPLAALAAFERDPGGFCAVITDQTMPRMTGVELAAKILAFRPTTPLILASGNLNAEVEHVGIRHTLRKPFDLDELSVLLRSLIADSAPD